MEYRMKEGTEEWQEVNNGKKKDRQTERQNDKYTPRHPYNNLLTSTNIRRFPFTIYYVL